MARKYPPSITTANATHTSSHSRLTPRTARRFVEQGTDQALGDSSHCLSPGFLQISAGIASALESPSFSQSSRSSSEGSDVHLLPHDDKFVEQSYLFPEDSVPTTPFLVKDHPAAPSEARKLGSFSAISIILGKTIGVGIYSVPSSIFNDVGSIGMSLLVWLVAAGISFCGLAVYIDLGTAMPRSGGEKVYLERIFRRPKFLASCIFMSYVVLLGFSTPNCIVLGEYAMYAIGAEVNRWNVRCVGVISITIACWAHARAPRLGLAAINVLGFIKMGIIASIGLAGAYSVYAKLGMRDANPSTSTFQQNYSNIFKHSTKQPYAYATAVLKALYCYRGYNTANQVLSEVRNPVRTLKRAAPAALSIVTLAYIVTNLAYFAAVSQTDIRSSGVVVAGHFFTNVFGEMAGAHILPMLIILSSFGSIAATSFAQARVNQELGKEGLLPFGSFFETSSVYGTPTAGLIIHWLVTVIVIVVPPSGEIYAFLVTLGAYPVSVLAVLVSGGLFYLKLTPSERWHSPAPASKAAVMVFLVANSVLIILPWVPPAGCRPIHTSLPSYAYPAGGCAVLAIGAMYWIWGSTKRWWYQSQDTEQSNSAGEEWKSPLTGEA